MKKVRIILSLLLVVFCIQFTYAQDANAILKSAKAKLASLQDISASFKFEVRNIAHRTKAPIVKKGSFKYKKGQYKIALGAEEYYCDGESIWVYMKNDQEVNIYEYDPEEAMNIDALFKLLETNSAKTRYDGTETVNGVEAHKIYMTISDPAFEYNQATVWISKSSKLPVKGVTKDRRQTTTTYELTNIKTNSGYSSGTFKFDVSKHPDVDVYDER